MEFTRRNILALGSGAFAAASFAGHAGLCIEN
jgi:hypothetical protein